MTVTLGTLVGAQRVPNVAVTTAGSAAARRYAVTVTLGTLVGAQEVTGQTFR